MNTDQYGEIINGPETYAEIKNYLNVGCSVLIGWTEEKGSHYDILFTLRPLVIGNIHGGMRHSYIYVSIVRLGAFGFEIGEESSPEYYGEKLGVGSGETQEKLAELINAVRVRLIS